MNIQHFFVCTHRSQCFWAVRLLVFLAVAVILWPQNAVAQHPAIPKLTLAQVEQLVSNKVPDSTLSAQIQKRGLAFAPNPTIVESLRAKGAGPLALAAVEELFPKGTRRAAISRTQLKLASGFYGPSGVAVDGDGNLFITDFHMATKEILAAGGYTTIRDLCSGPSIIGVAVSESGNLFLAGPGFDELHEVQAAIGCPTVRTFPRTSGFAQAVAVDRSGNVFLADSGNREVSGAVREIPPGCASTGCVKTLGGGFNSPWSVAVSKSGSVFVADTDNNAVKEIPPGCVSASCVRALGSGFSRPTGVALDGSGTIYVSDTGNNAVKEIPPGCVSAVCVRTLGSDFNFPRGVAVDRRGNLFVADQKNHRVVELKVVGPSATPDAMTSRAASANEFALVIDPPSNVRVAPSAASGIICSVDTKRPIRILGSEGNWYKTDTCEGKLGYIHRSQVKF